MSHNNLDILLEDEREREKERYIFESGGNDVIGFLIEKWLRQI